MSEKQKPVDTPKPTMFLQPKIELAANVKAMINIGALFDIPTGTYINGRYGERVLNGGLGTLTGIVGIGNNFKSTIMHYKSMCAVARMGGQSSLLTYDTEINIHEWHLRSAMEKITAFKGEDVLATGRWQITDKTVYSGDQWYDIAKDFMQGKKKNKIQYTISTPFLDRDGTSLMKMIIPTGIEIDSMSEFSTADVIKMQDDASLGDSAANMVSMRQGMQKNRMLMELPGDAGSSNTFVLMSAHIGNEFNMDPRNPPPKKLQYLKGVKIKGVPEKFTFVMNNCWHCYNAAPLINQATKAPDYPRDSDDDMTGDTDLNVVTVRQLRSKSGPSGMAVELIVSQADGVLSSLSEFHFLKEKAARFGLVGNMQNYTVALCPDIKLSRTVVRGKIEKHHELRRSLNFLAEIAQMGMLWHHLTADDIVDPERLYSEITELGYNWDDIYNTRGWWAPVGQHTDLKFLSTMDLLRMRQGLYIPYWLENPPEKALAKYLAVNGKKWLPWGGFGKPKN